MSKVSVLVAVYNAADYLPKCLDSLLGQTMADVQVLCVDDASTDGSWAVLCDYARRDSRIEAYHLDENRGQAHARNVGLQHATGDYVTFLDSDDWLDQCTLEKVVDVFQRHPQTDCVLLREVKCDGEGREVERAGSETFDVMTGREAFEASLTWRIHGIYVARRELYERYPYDDSCRSYSDDNTTRLHYYIAREVRCCDGIYYYRMNPQSVTHRVSVRRFDYLRANESMKRQLEALGVAPEVMACYENERWQVLVGTYMFYHVHGRELPPADRRFGLAELHRVWGSIDRALLNKRATAKFGYRPCRSWAAFRLQEWLYFTLRGLLGRNY